MDVVKGFFDLCIQEQCVAGEKYEPTIKALYNYGYRTIAINRVFDDANLEVKKKKKKGEIRATSEVVPAPSEYKQVVGCDDMKILTRLTIAFNNQDSMHKILKSPAYKKYDLIAIQPQTQAAFQFTCSNVDGDILSYDPEELKSYKFNRKLYNQLVTKGYHFEIVYGPAISDATQRRNIIQTAHLYHTLGKSRSIIVSSGATSSMLIRGPYDVINLGLIFGMNEEQSKNAITHCARSVYINSVGRRHGKAVMLVENVSGNDDLPPVSMDTDECDDEDDDNDPNQPAQKKIKSIEVAILLIDLTMSLTLRPSVKVPAVIFIKSVLVKQKTLYYTPPNGPNFQQPKPKAVFHKKR